MPNITRIGTYTEASSTSSSGSFSVTVPEDADCCIFLVSGMASGGADIIDELNWDNGSTEDFTFIVDSYYTSTSDVQVQAYYMLRSSADWPGSGSKTLYWGVTGSRQEGLRFCVLFYKNVAQSSPVRDTDSQNQHTSDFTASLTGVISEDMTIGASYQYTDPQQNDHSTNSQTEILSSAFTGNASLVCGEKQGESGYVCARTSPGTSGGGGVSIVFALKARTDYGYATAENSTTVSDTKAKVTTGSNRVFVAAVLARGGSNTNVGVSSVTLDGETGTETELRNTNPDGNRNRITTFHWLDTDMPSTAGDYTLTATMDAGNNNDLILFWTQLEGRNQSTPEATAETDSDNVTTISDSITTIADDAIIVDFGYHRQGAILEEDSGTRRLVSVANSGDDICGAIGLQTKASAGSESMGWDSTGASETMVQVLLSYAPATGATTYTLTTTASGYLEKTNTLTATASGYLAERNALTLTAAAYMAAQQSKTLDAAGYLALVKQLQTTAAAYLQKVNTLTADAAGYLKETDKTLTFIADGWLDNGSETNTLTFIADGILKLTNQLLTTEAAGYLQKTNLLTTEAAGYLVEASQSLLTFVATATLYHKRTLTFTANAEIFRGLRLTASGYLQKSNTLSFTATGYLQQQPGVWATHDEYSDDWTKR